MHHRVRQILSFWSRCCKRKLSKSEAISFWMRKAMDHLSVVCMQVANLTAETDRVAVLRYALTGALYEDATTTVGSIVMCYEDEHIGVRQLGESCLEAAPTEIHMHHKIRTSSLDILSRYRYYFEEKLTTFMSLFRAGTVIFKPSLQEVTKSNTSLISFLQSLSAHVISWSNVSDYMPPTDFHALASRISGPDTVHFLHSCNWTTCVYGTDIYDVNKAARGALYQNGYKLMRVGQQNLVGFSALPVSHFRNIAQPVLLRKFIKTYLRYFFANQHVRVGTYCGVCPVIPVGNPFMRSDSVAHFQFTYVATTSINFGQDNYDYLTEEE